jgi:hypothetical protein
MIFILHKLRYSKITNLDIAFRRKENIVQLNIPMQDPFRMYILEPLNDLPKKELGIILLELSPPPDVGEEIPAPTHLHHVNDVRLCVEAFV